MQPTNADDLIQRVGVPLHDPTFYPKLFSLVAIQASNDDIAQAISEDYDELSQRLDGTFIQEGCSVRNLLRSRALAKALINEQGELRLDLLPKVEAELTRNLYSLGPDREHDGRRNEHFLRVVKLLQSDKDLRQQLKMVTRPLGHKLGEQVIRDTLQLEANTALTDVHARQAALAAWLCFLRQNVGSCFATAPAIIVHDEQPQQFLKDIIELLNTGRLKRTFGGVEYTAPMSFSWGAGDLRKQFMISRADEGGGMPIWRSPGLVEAFKAAGLIEGDNSIQQTKILIQNLLQETPEQETHITTSAEQLIRLTLLKNLGLTDQDLQDYQNRPKPMLQSNLLIQIQHSSGNLGGTGNKSELCSRYFAHFDAATKAFKAIKDNALLKTWEFTVASFAETKSDFAKWNLYASLGLGADEPGGIGQRLYQIVQQKLEQTNAKVHEYQQEYEQLYSQLKYLEGRLQRAVSEQEIKWLRVDYESKVNEFRTFEDMRNDTHEKAKRYANLFSGLVERYLQLFPEYFQEVYDADLHEVDVGPYDDSPAGFRLVYKHGRTNTALWQPIHNHVEFVEALASFFILSESQIGRSDEFAGLETDLGQIITDIVTHVKTPVFLESAFHRMAVAHKGRPIKDPLQHLEQIEKKPWAYTSGGTMDTLVSAYFRREERPTTASRWVENEVELLVFLLDSVKHMPAKQLEECIEKPNRSMLIHSPTHAFVLKPSLKNFRDGVLDNTYTYIWVRDNFVKPSQRFVDDIFVDREMMQELLRILAEKTPPHYRDFVRHAFRDIPGRMKAREFRQYILEQQHQNKALAAQGISVFSENQVDSFLYAELPMCHGYQIRPQVIKMLEALRGMTAKRLSVLTLLYDKANPSSRLPKAASASQLKRMVKSLLILESRSARSSQDLHHQVSQAAQKLGFAMPSPIMFADTNWVTDFFGFVANPGNGQYEFWRLDYTGSEGACMSHWKQWLNGSRKDIPWGVYIRPTEYRF